MFTSTNKWRLYIHAINTLLVLIFAGLNFRGNKISRELIREIHKKTRKFAKFNSREIRKKSAFAKFNSREILVLSILDYFLAKNG